MTKFPLTCFMLAVGVFLASFIAGEKPDKNSLIEFAVTKRIQGSLDDFRDEVRQYGHITIAVRSIPAKFYLPKKINGLPVVYKSHMEMCEWVGKTGMERNLLILNGYKRTGKNEAFLFIANWLFHQAPVSSSHPCQVDLGGMECGGSTRVKRKYRGLLQYTYYKWNDSTGWEEGGVDYY